MNTNCASLQKSSKADLNRQINYIKSLVAIEDLTDVICDGFLILNLNKEIVFFNNAFLSIVDKNASEIYGLRPGEAFNCIHASEPGGCGGTEFCKYCGGGKTVEKSREIKNIVHEDECRIIIKDTNQSLDFKVRAKSLVFDHEDFTLFVVHDSSNEKRRQVLEKIFFHDILNTAGGIRGLVELLEEIGDEEIQEIASLAKLSFNVLVEEINAQRDLLAAENNSLKLRWNMLNSIDILTYLASFYKKQYEIEEKKIKISTDSESLSFITDERLLGRVLGNMLKNALEAEERGSMITMKVARNKDNIRFSVYNPSVMSEKAIMQVFQRSFSTKGFGRGVGTYSIKLIGEKYLNGRVGFTSCIENGTEFFIDLPMNVKE